MIPQIHKIKYLGTILPELLDFFVDLVSTKVITSTYQKSSSVKLSAHLFKTFHAFLRVRYQKVELKIAFFPF